LTTWPRRAAATWTPTEQTFAVVALAATTATTTEELAATGRGRGRGAAASGPGVGRASDRELVGSSRRLAIRARSAWPESPVPDGESRCDYP
jgi:hypothetical protein